MAREEKNSNGRGTTFGKAIGRVQRGHKSGLKAMHGTGASYGHRAAIKRED